MNIMCVDINETEDEIVERIDESDVIFLCVPLDQTLPWITKYGLFLKDKIIVEQTSLKEPLFEDAQVKDLNVIPMHILFRPSSTPNMADRKVGLFTKTDMSVGLLETIKDITQAEVVWFRDVCEHDVQMAVTQALVHRTILALAKALECLDASTYVGNKIIELSNRIKKGDKKLYKAIQDNKYTSHQLETFVGEICFFDIEKYFN